jgi:hypothetical protein
MVLSSPKEVGMNGTRDNTVFNFSEWNDTEIDEEDSFWGTNRTLSAGYHKISVYEQQRSRWLSTENLQTGV